MSQKNQRQLNLTMKIEFILFDVVHSAFSNEFEIKRNKIFNALSGLLKMNQEK